MNVEQIRTEGRKLANGGASIEQVIAYLRTSGCSKALSIALIADVRGCEMNEAKRLVHFSPTWADVKESDEEWQDRIDEGGS